MDFTYFICGISKLWTYCGAKIDFVDVCPDTFNIDNFFRNKLIHAKKKGKLPKIIVTVHMGGLSCDMKKINTFSKKYGLKL